jgi:hypothetical protein
MEYLDLMSSTVVPIPQYLHDPAPGLSLVAELKPDAIFLFHGVQHPKKFPPVHCLWRCRFPGIIPEVNILKALNTSTMLTQDHDLNASLLRSDKLCPEPVMLLADIPAQLLQILLPVNHQPRIIQGLVVATVQL